MEIDWVRDDLKIIWEGGLFLIVEKGFGDCVKKFYFLFFYVDGIYK